ncbi:hypothetical protein T35B1_17051 [Salinisphaera shabanensis T35B1]|uniref:hypothetical protein n=1 Tax=Salinisphaera shabanensis TaxID=180542 RepID=UPI00333F0A3C
MKNRFILVVDDATKEQRDEITRFFKEQQTGYWHWFKDTWLITDISQRWNSVSLRDAIQRLVPGVNTLILKVESGTDWAAFGRKEQFEWLHKTWND